MQTIAVDSSAFRLYSGFMPRMAQTQVSELSSWKNMTVIFERPLRAMPEILTKRKAYQCNLVIIQTGLRFTLSKQP